MGMPFIVSPAATYASKSNIAFPGTQAQATAAEAAAQTRINELLASQGLDGLTITVAAGAIEVAS